MEKMTWTRPVAAVEQFMPNEYIAACTDFTKKYFEFKCDAGGGEWGDIWEGGTLSTNRYGQTEISGGTNLTPGRLGAFHACPKEHYVEEADVNTTFTTGYFHDDYDDSRSGGTWIPVVIWQGDGDVHATQALKEDIKVVTGNKS